jgi:hypothetical protein
MSNKDYVIVNRISSFLIRYIIHKDDLQKLNPNKPCEPVEWAKDVMDADWRLEEFSQEHLGEYTVDVNVVNEEYVLDLFDQRTYHPKSQSKEDKIKSIRQNWFNDTHTRWVAQDVWGAWKVND